MPTHLIPSERGLNVISAPVKPGAGVTILPDHEQDQITSSMSGVDDEMDLDIPEEVHMELDDGQSHSSPTDQHVHTSTSQSEAHSDPEMVMHEATGIPKSEDETVSSKNEAGMVSGETQSGIDDVTTDEKEPLEQVSSELEQLPSEPQELDIQLVSSEVIIILR